MWVNFVIFLHFFYKLKLYQQKKFPLREALSSPDQVAALTLLATEPGVDKPINGR